MEECRGSRVGYLSMKISAMGILRGSSDYGREQIVLAHQAEHPLAGTRMSRRRPEAEPRPCGRGRCQIDQVALRSPPAKRLVRGLAGFGPRRFAGGCSACWPEVTGVERGAGRSPGETRRRPLRPDPCRARWRHSSPRPPPPQRAEGLRLGLQQPLRSRSDGSDQIKAADTTSDCRGVRMPTPPF